jgi:hypothetical protein
MSTNDSESGCLPCPNEFGNNTETDEASLANGANLDNSSQPCRSTAQVLSRPVENEEIKVSDDVTTSQVEELASH